MKILSLRAENIKRLKVVEITPSGNLVQITGKNGEGKSSVLDSLVYALEGTTHVPSKPVRKGSGKGSIKLTLGEHLGDLKDQIIVTRKFTESGGTTLSVEAATGAKFPSPQTMLDKLLGRLTFDPLAFTRMDAITQLNTLRSMVDLGGVDIDALESQNKSDFDRRTVLNRQIKTIGAQRAAITLPINLPHEPVDISELVAQLQSVSKHNSDREREANVRENKLAGATSLQQSAETKREQAMRLMEEADELDNQAIALTVEIETLPELPEILDSDDIAIAIEQGRETNKGIEQRERWMQLDRECNELNSQTQTLTDNITNRTKIKTDAIAGAQMPLEGLTFGDGEVIYNGLPLDQASDAEQLRISIAIAIAANPTLRVLRIKDGSLLDENSLRLVAEMAEESDMQVWIEQVSNGESVGVVLEDGMVKSVN